MAQHVEVHYEELESMRNSFEQQAQEIQNMLQKMMGQVDNLKGGAWVGTGGDAFYNEMHGEILPAVQRLVNSMHEGAHVVSQIMEKFKNAEEEAKNVWVPY
jgi:WXG100 family type VII secretion target